MSWDVVVKLNSGEFVTIEDLISINTESSYDSSIDELIDFRRFHLSGSQRLSFIGKNSTLTLLSDKIEYVQFNNG